MSLPTSKPGPSSKKKEIHPVDNFIGGVVGGVLANGVFHPVDTATKRLQTTTYKINLKDYKSNIKAGVKEVMKGNLKTGTKTIKTNLKAGANAILENFEQVVFKDVSTHWRGRARSLYDGILASSFYKFTQFGTKFFVQASIEKKLEERYGQTLEKKYGANTKFIIGFISGSTGGVAEAGITLIPEALKVMYQVDGKFVTTHKREEIFKEVCIRGMASFPWVATRNLFGSGILFGFDAHIKEVILHVGDKHASFYQNLISSSGGQLASIIGTLPIDNVRNRILSGKFGSQSGVQIVKNMYLKEGISSFFRGASFKLATKWPQGTLGFTLAQQAKGYLGSRRESQKPSSPSENHVPVRKRP